MDEPNALVIQAEGILVCTFLRREIDSVRACILEADEKTSGLDNDKRLLDSMIETYNWIADVTENEELRDLIPENKE